MAKKRTEPAVNDAIASILKETGQSDPAAAIRAKARELIQTYHVTFSENPPFDLKAMASLRDISHSDEAPVHSPDSELLPDDDGRVVMRINQDRPRTRQRFSIGHEITHTFFPGYEEKVQCRKPAERDWSDPEDVIEWLCDVGASEFLFPMPWFEKSVSECAETAQGIFDLARYYRASPDATVRRYVEIASIPVAAVFLTWKLKPTQKDVLGRTDQANLFGITPEEEIREALRLRIDYAIASQAFGAAGHFLPRDKSVENDGPVYEAAQSGRPCDGECHLDLGQAAGTYRVHAMPLWTPAEELGPAGENAVVAVIRPLTIRDSKKKVAPTGVSLFDGV